MIVLAGECHIRSLLVLIHPIPCSDRLLDFPRLISELGSHCKLTKCVPHHQHLDSLVAIDSHEIIYPDIVTFIEQIRA